MWGSSWVSTDGRTWQAAPRSTGLEESALYSILSMPGGGLVAVGCNECRDAPGGPVEVGTPAAWTSTDGLSWIEVGLPSAERGLANQVLQLDSGLVAIGRGATGALTWTSSDGVRWEAGTTLPRNTEGFMEDAVTARGDELLLFLNGSMMPGSPAFEAVLWRGSVQ